MVGLYISLSSELSQSRARADVFVAREVKGGMKTPQNKQRLSLDSNSTCKVQHNQTELKFLHSLRILRLLFCYYKDEGIFHDHFYKSTLHISGASKSLWNNANKYKDNLFFWEFIKHLYLLCWYFFVIGPLSTFCNVHSLIFFYSILFYSHSFIQLYSII